MRQNHNGDLNYGEEVGTLVGHSDKPGTLEMVVAFTERDKAPRLGEFVIVQESVFLRRKILCRVEVVGYGDFQTTRGERQRALVEKYLRDVAGHERNLTEEEKRTLFFLGYTLKVLGEIREKKEKNGIKLVIATDYRMLPDLTATCRFPLKEEFDLIVSAGLTSGKLESKPTIGNLAYGEQQIEIPIPFEPDLFDAKRTAVFARTGYGKSNLTRILVALAAMIGKSGIFVLDLDGEYAFGTQNPDGTQKYGLADIDWLKPKLVVYTERKDVAQRYPGIDIRGVINLEKLDPQHIADLMLERV